MTWRSSHDPMVTFFALLAPQGSKIHPLSDRAGLHLAVDVSVANTQDNHAFRPLFRLSTSAPTSGSAG
jgi:hypothetical protein